MKVLGLGLGYLATAAVSVDGDIVAAVSEERFSKKKNEEGYPRMSVEFCLRQAGLDGSDLDYVVIAGKSVNPVPWLTKNYSSFSIADHMRAQREYWYPRLIEGKAVSWLDLFRDKVDLSQFPGNWEEILGDEHDHHAQPLWERLKPRLFGAIADHVGIPEDRIILVDHHSCHAAYAYWGGPHRDGRSLVVTADAWGDDLSATLSVAEDGAIRRFKAIPHNEFKLGRMYRYITLLLGMKPAEHEYKVMGLAPYAKPAVYAEPYKAFRETMYVDGLDFKWKVDPKDLYFHFRDRLEGCRFDGIAGGLQLYCEEILAEWIGNAIKETGTGQVAFSGGVSMNIKANMILHGLDAVCDLYVCPSGGDESIPIGACYLVETERAGSPDERRGSGIRPFQPLLGPEYSPQEVRAWVTEKKLSERYSVTEGVSNAEVAELLSRGIVIGRMVGRMEFGARSLGNRAILADPRSPAIVEKINHMIKQRDFWMPFAPTILEEAAADYMVNPKGISSPFMTIGFESTELAREHLPAALHSADKTMRPQVVRRSDNPKYHDLISRFRQITGVGGLLNTSFNLHGLPIVLGPDDALHVFENSDIDAILLEDVLVAKQAEHGPSGRKQ
ncbi:MAG: carbamoyltransferase C-terminal domain-containing protein [Hyphomicrobiales bacterium]